MRTIFYMSWLLCVSNVLNAQDTLYKTDGSKQIVKIREVNETQVKYILTSNLNGPTYVIIRDDVIKIVYETGLIDSFPKSVEYDWIPVRKEDPRITDFGRNFIAVNVLDLLQGTLKLSYEYIFNSGGSGIKFPLSFKVFDRRFSFSNSYNDKIFGMGLDYYFYPHGQGRIKFFYGPSFEYKQFEPFYSSGENSEYAFLFQGGFLYQPEKHLNISINAGLGYAQSITRYYNDGGIAGRAGLNIGYKF